MAQLSLVRFYHPDSGVRVGVRRDHTVADVTGHFPSVAAWLQSSSGRAQAAIDDLASAADSAGATYAAALFENPPVNDKPHWLAPVDLQDVWAAGVTYTRSREARQEEAKDGGDVYARVYEAERPELFFKAKGSWVVGPHGEIGIRRDATWNVPEPELTLVMNPALEIIGYTAGNDVSSRDIEGENPLYLPQAKVYAASCALGNGILLTPLSEFPAADIRVEIVRAGKTVFADSVNTSRIHRKARELVDYLGRCLEFPEGAALMTGTGIVPPSTFTLQISDIVKVRIEANGATMELSNTVKVV